MYDLYGKYLINSKQALEKKLTITTEPDSPPFLRQKSLDRESHGRNFESLSSLDSSASEVYLQADQDQMEKISKLSEKRIITFVLLCFFLPFLVFGILAIYFPFVNAFLPVYEAEICVCSFYQEWADGRNFFVFNASHASILENINRSIFYIANCSGLLIIISMVFRIRHVADETLIKKECAMIVVVWIVCSIWVFGTFISETLADCVGGWTYTDALRVSYQVSYWSIILRNVIVTGITLYFQFRVSRSNLYYSRLLDADNRDTTKVALADFEMLLVSVIPYKAFARFLT